MRILRYATLVVLLAGLLGCETIKTRHDVDPEAPFGSYSTWAWLSDEPFIGGNVGETDVSYVSEIDDRRIRRAVERDMQGKGYRQGELESADLVVVFAVGTEEKSEVRSSPSMGVYSGGYGYGGYMGTSDVRTYHYTQGTLRIEFFDRKTKNAVWVGWASKRLSAKDEAEDTVNKAVAKILEPFPNGPYYEPPEEG